MGAATVRVRVSGLRGLFRLLPDGDDGGRPARQSHRHSKYGVSDSLLQMTSAVSTIAASRTNNVGAWR